MKHFKRGLALLLALAALVSFAGCKKDTVKEDIPLSATAKEAQALIDKGEYEEAYNLLYALENPDENERKLLASFRWLPTNAESDNGYSVSISYTDRGMLLDRETTGPDGFWSSESHTYDERGNDISCDKSDSEGYWEIVQRACDAMGNPLTYEASALGHDEGVAYHYEYSYTQDGLMLSCKIYNTRDQLLRVYTYTYNAEGKCLTERCETDDGWEQKTYTYDENGRNIATTYINSDGLQQAAEFTYDEKGNLLSDKGRASDGGWYEFSYTYDAKGNRLTEQKSDSDDTWHKYSYTYDAKGNRLTEKLEGSGQQKTDTTFTYDEKGALLTQTEQTGEEKPVTYTFDCQLYYNANWAEADPYYPSL